MSLREFYRIKGTFDVFLSFYYSPIFIHKFVLHHINKIFEELTQSKLGILCGIQTKSQWTKSKSIYLKKWTNSQLKFADLGHCPNPIPKYYVRESQTQFPTAICRTRIKSQPNSKILSRIKYQSQFTSTRSI